MPGSTWGERNSNTVSSTPRGGSCSKTRLPTPATIEGFLDLDRSALGGTQEKKIQTKSRRPGSASRAYTTSKPIESSSRPITAGSTTSTLSRPSPAVSTFRSGWTTTPTWRRMANGPTAPDAAFRAWSYSQSERASEAGSSSAETSGAGDAGTPARSDTSSSIPTARAAPAASKAASKRNPRPGRSSGNTPRSRGRPASSRLRPSCLRKARRPPSRPKDIYNRAKGGEKAAREAFARAGYYLGIGLGILINLLNPEKILLGGGVMTTGEYLLAPAVEEAARRSYRASFAACSIERAGLGNDAGIIGAASWARRKSVAARIIRLRSKILNKTRSSNRLRPVALNFLP